MHAYFEAWKGTFDFRGTMTRAEFTWFILVQLAIYILVGVGLAFDATLQANVLTVLAVLHILPTLAAEVRRLHDYGKSGYFVLLQLFPLMLPLMIAVLMVRPSDHTSEGTSITEAAAPLDVGDLSQLASLWKSGALTDDEFAQLKGQLMSRARESAR